MANDIPEIAGYSRFRLIGRGGYSAVYSATQDAFQRTVAIKVITVDLDDSMRRRFTAECQALGKLASHPNIIDVYDSGESADGRPYVAMRLCEGGSTADAVARANGPVALSWILDIGAAVAGALAHAHSQGVIHRDIKPANILLDGAGNPVVVDFGIATLEGVESKTMTSSVFTPAHAAPERFDLEPGDAKTDVYSLCSTLFSLIEGHAPYERPEGNSINAIVKRMLTEDPPAVTRPDVGEPVRAIIAGGLSKDPSERPDMDQLAAVLGAARTELDRVDQTQFGGAAAALAHAYDPGANPAPSPLPPPIPAGPLGTGQPVGSQGWYDSGAHTAAGTTPAFLAAGSPHTPLPNPPPVSPDATPTPQFPGERPNGGANGSAKKWGLGAAVAGSIVVISAIAGASVLALQGSDPPDTTTSTTSTASTTSPEAIFKTPEEVWTSGQTDFSFGAFSDDGLLVTWVDADGKAKSSRTADDVEYQVASDKPVTAEALTPDGQLLAITSGDKDVAIVDPLSGDIKRDVRSRTAVDNLQFAPSTHTLAINSTDGYVELFNADTGVLRSRVTVESGLEAQTTSTSVSNFSLNGQYLAAGPIGTGISIFRVEDGSKVGDCEGSAQDVNGIYWSQANHVLLYDAVRRTFATCAVTQDGTGTVTERLDAITNHYKSTDDTPNDVVVVAEGTDAGGYLVVASGPNLDVWQLTGDTGPQLVNTIEPPDRQDGADIDAVWMSSTGRYVSYVAKDLVVVHDFEGDADSIITYVVDEPEALFAGVLESQKLLLTATNDEIKLSTLNT